MNRNFRAICIFAMAMLSATSARADYFLEFVPQGQFVLGGSLTVDIVLRETRLAGQTSQLANNIMISGNLRITRSGSTAYLVSAVDGHGDQGGRQFDNGFDDGVTVNPPTILPADPSLASEITIEQYDGIDSALDPLGTENSAIEATLRLGRFVLSGGAEGETVTFSLQDFDSGFEDIVLFDGANSISLDSLITYGSSDFTVAAIPEPSSMLAVGVLVGGAGFRQWRKRRAAGKRSQA